jgi:glycine oxidase
MLVGNHEAADVVIAGGGAIGTAIAWRAALHGLRVTLVDPAWGSPGTDAATEVAAGMLGPVSESVFGEQDLLALNLLAIARFPGFAAELEAVTGEEVGLRTEGTLTVAYDKADHDRLARLTAFRHSLGLAAQQLDARECRDLEPFLAPGVHGGVLAIGDLSVDNRRYAKALRGAAALAGVRVISGSVTAAFGTATEAVPGSATTAAGGSVTAASGSVTAASGSVTAASGSGVIVDGAQFIPARTVVLAAGWRTGQIGGLPRALGTAFRPVKGQILRLRHPEGMPPVATRTIRAIVRGTDVYLVPRADGEVVVGATQDERADRLVTAGAVHDLLHDAMSVLPAISELTLAEVSAGLRPGSVDNGPVVGLAAPGLIVAAGHFRNGIMLSAATADAVADLLTGGEPAAEWKAFTPGRLPGGTLRLPGGTPPDPQALSTPRGRLP